MENIIDCFNRALECGRNDFFTFLYYSKQYGLMNECYYGNDFVINTAKELEIIKDKLSNYDSIEKLTLVICRLSEELRKNIPCDILDDYENSDYEKYTDRYYHRQYWNQIPNFDFIEIFLSKFEQLYKACNKDTIDTKGEYCIRLYGFNDYEIYFKSLESLEKFASLYDLIPYSVYKVNKSYYEELYTV